MDQPRSEPQNSLSNMLKFSWGIGGLGTTSMLYLINMFVVFFLVRHIGISAAIAGSLFAVTRVYDAVIDPLIGSLSDRSKGRWGRRRPWMLAGAILCPLAVVAVFNPPTLAPGPSLYAAVLGSLLLYCTAYSLFAIPYTAMGAELTDNYGERASVMAWRTFFVYASGIAITGGAPALIAALGSDQAAYSSMSLVAAALVAFTLFWVVFFTGNAPLTYRSDVKLTAIESLRTAASNRPFLTVLLTKMMGQLGTAFTGASLLFFMADVLLRGEKAQALLGFVSNIVGVCSVPVWGWLLRSVERRPLLVTLLSFSALTHLSWLVATPAEPQVWFIVRAFLIGALGAGSVLVAMTMVADTIEYDRLKTGQRREGMFVGAFELMQTTSFVVAPLLAGFAFSAAGLVPGQRAAGDQPQSAIDAIRIMMSVLPAICSSLGVLLVLSYRLDAGKLAALRATGVPGTAGTAEAAQR
jgi:GPH family glycoside/pentoside/hexuronide:cation symporter